MPFTQNTSPTFAKQPKLGLAQIVNADASAQKTVITAGGNGSKVLSLRATSTDTSARDVQFAVVRGGTTYVLGTVAVALTAGFINSAPSVDLLNTSQSPIGSLPFDHDGQKYINLESGDTLVVLALTTVTAAKAISVFAEYEDF
jgi:uncharacterized protein (UPF0371 family)